MWCFDYYVSEGISFLVWSPVCSFFKNIPFFRLEKFSSIILLKIFTGPLSWKSLLSSIPIILRFGLLIVSLISWMFWVRTFLHFAFSLTVVSLFSMISSSSEILLSFVFCC